MTIKKKQINRRDFLKIIAVAGAGVAMAKFGFDKLNYDDMVDETRLLMGTVINIKAVGLEPERTRQAISACLNRMEELENVLSRFKSESQLSQLNRDGELLHAHPVLLSLVEQSLNLSSLTDGAFDISIKPVLDLYKNTPGVLPDADQVKKVLSLVDYHRIGVEGDALFLRQHGMSITLDGIAKGFIVDEGVAVLKKYGFSDVMVEAGGDLLGLGEKAPHSPWKIGLQGPRSAMGNLMTTFNIQDRAVATSGDYMQTFSPDFANHHIIDPRTGYSSPELASVSIFAPSATLADGLATAVMVLGKSALPLLKKIPNCEIYAITKDLQIIQS
jgi:thiamine biosynthesis lipoprotein